MRGVRATASEPAVGHLPDAIIAEAHHNVLRLRHDQLQPTEMTVLPVTSSGGFRMTLGSQFLVRELTLGPDVSIDVSVRSPSASGRPRCPASLVFVLTSVTSAAASGPLPCGGSRAEPCRHPTRCADGSDPVSVTIPAGAG